MDRFQAGLEKLRATFQCGICLEMMVTPIITPCHHSYCQMCIHKHLEGKRSIHVKCPICNASGLTKRSLRRDDKTEAILKAMQTVGQNASLEYGSTSAAAKDQTTPSSSRKPRAKETKKEDPGLIYSPEKKSTDLKGRRAPRKRSNSPPKAKKPPGPKKPAAQQTLKQTRRQSLKSKAEDRALRKPWVKGNDDILDYLKSDSDVISEASESFTDPEVQLQEKLDTGETNQRQMKNEAKNCVSMKSIMDNVKEQAQAPSAMNKKRKILHTPNPEDYETLIRDQEKEIQNAPGNGDEGSSSLSIHDQPVKPSRLASKKRRTNSKSPAGKLPKVVDTEEDQSDRSLQPPSAEPSSFVPENPTNSRPTRSRSQRKSSILKSSLLEIERRRPSPKKKSSKKVMFVRLGPLSKRHSNCPPNREVEPKPESFGKKTKEDKIEETINHEKSPGTSGDPPPRPSRTNSFMADIIGNDKDIYSSDEESLSQEKLRLKRMRENNSIVKELAFEDGRLRAKRSRILPVYSSNESSEDTYSQTKLIDGPPIKDRTNLPMQQRSVKTKQKTISNYLQSKRSSFVTMPSKEDFSHAPQAKEEDLVHLISPTPDPDENMESAFPPVPLGRLELKPLIVGKNLSRSDTSDFIGNTVDIAMPVKGSRFSNSTVSTEDTNNSDGSTQAIEEKIRKMKEMLPIQDSCQDLDVPRTPEKTGANSGQVLESDDDLFESTPQAPTSNRLKETRRSRVPDETKTVQEPRKRLDYPDPDPFLDDNENNPIEIVKERDSDHDEQEDALPLSQVLATSMYFPQESKVISDEEARKIVLITSGLDIKSRELVKRFAQFSGCTLKTNLDKHITHVIVAHDDDLQAEVTLKFLQGVSLGKFLIGIQWIRDCCDKEKVLDYHDYEVKHSSGEDGPFRSRMAHEEHQPLLFKDYAFILKGKFQTIPEDKFRELLQWSGGKIWRSPVTINNEDRGKRFIIVDRQSPHVESECVKLFRSTGMVVIEKDWIIDCLAQYSVMSFLQYMLHPSIGSDELLKEGYHPSMLDC